MLRVRASAFAVDDRGDAIAPAIAPAKPLAYAELASAQINPRTGLATDYLNHFNEAIMLLELVAEFPECRADLRAWRPLSYCEHFRQSRFAGRDLAIRAYEAADPATRDALDALTDTMTTLIEHARTAMIAAPNAAMFADAADRAAGWLRLLIAQAGAVINGQRSTGLDGTPQSAADRVIG